MKIALITAPDDSYIEKCETSYEVGAMAALHELCEQEYIVLNGNSTPLEKLHLKMDEFQPDVVCLLIQQGYGIWSWLGQFFRGIEDQAETYPCIALGSGASLLQFQLLSRFSMIKFIVRGETDIAYSELLETLENESNVGLVKNIAFRADNKIVVSPPQEINKYPDELPLPIFDNAQLTECVPICLSNRLHRGRHFTLTNPFIADTYFLKSTQRIIEEAHSVDKNLPVFFLDENIFTVFKNDRDKITNFFSDLKNNIADFQLRCTTRDVDKSFLLALKECGLGKLYLTIIIQAGDNFVERLNVLDAMQVDYRIEQVLFAPDISLDDFFAGVTALEQQIIPEYQPISGYSLFRQLELFPENIETGAELRNEHILPEISGLHRLLNFYKKKRIGMFYSQIFPNDGSQPAQFDAWRTNLWKLDFMVLKLLSQYFQNIKSGTKISESIYQAIREYNLEYQIKSEIGKTDE